MNFSKRVILFSITFTVIVGLCVGSQAEELDPDLSVVEPPCCCLPANAAISLRKAAYEVPNVMVCDQKGVTRELSDVFPNDHVIVMQFGFTSCSTICPVASGTMAATQKSLQDQPERVAFVTISIDPEFDTPARLAEYAQDLNAKGGWLFLTGKLQAIAEIQKAFSAYVPNKSQHEALIFLRAAKSDRWIRVTGLVSSEVLTGEVKKLLESAGSVKR